MGARRDPEYVGARLTPDEVDALLIKRPQHTGFGTRTRTGRLVIVHRCDCNPADERYEVAVEGEQAHYGFGLAQRALLWMFVGSLGTGPDTRFHEIAADSFVPGPGNGKKARLN